MHLVPRGNSKSQRVPAPRPLLCQEPAACSEAPSVGQQLAHSTPRPIRNKATQQTEPPDRGATQPEAAHVTVVASVLGTGLHNGQDSTSVGAKECVPAEKVGSS